MVPRTPAVLYINDTLTRFVDKTSFFIFIFTNLQHKTSSPIPHAVLQLVTQQSHRGIICCLFQLGFVREYVATPSCTTTILTAVPVVLTIIFSLLLAYDRRGQERREKTVGLNGMFSAHLYQIDEVADKAGKAEADAKMAVLTTTECKSTMALELAQMELRLKEFITDVVQRAEDRIGSKVDNTKESQKVELVATETRVMAYIDKKVREPHGQY